MPRFRRHLFGSVPLVALAAALACGGESLVIPPTTGTLRVTTSTSGAEPDANGYVVQLDGGVEQAIGASASLQIEAVTPGTHAVLLAGVAPNCTVGGENPRTVSITAGETATVAFEVTCSTTTGSLQVSSSTSGPSIDPDGYGVNVDGTDRGFLTPTGNLTIEGLTAGDHLIGLSGLAGNCQVQGDNPRTATITAGAGATIAFAITCTAPPANAGSLRITTATTGADPDPNGYAFAVDGGAAQPIGVSTSTPLIPNIAAGAHTVLLSGVAPNCTVGGTNPRAVDVSSGSTAEVSFAITCSASTGTIRVNVTTLTMPGAPTDPNGYTVTLDATAPSRPVATTGTTTFPDVPAGTHTIVLAGLATNCSVPETSLRVDVTVGGTAEVSFAVTCVAPARIAFVSKTGDVGDVFTVNPDGSDRSRLTDGLTISAGSPQWSPDRSKIVFEGGEHGGEIYVINADGTGLRNLTNTPSGIGGGQETGPRWSPDGGRILFTRTILLPPEGDQQESDLWTMDGAGGGQVNLTQTGTEGTGGGYDWSPDGSQIAFGSERDGSQGVYVMSASGAGANRLTGAAPSWGPQWSPDGGRIVFLTDWEVWVMDANGSNQRPLTSDAGPSDLKDGPVWSPDGNKIAYTHQNAGSSDIWAMNPDGSGKLNVTNSGEDNRAAVWSPDGRQFAFTFGAGSGSPVIRVINADGSGLRTNVSGRTGSSPDW